MCLIVHISTTSEEDFTKLPTDDYRLEHPDEEADAAYLARLSHPHKWFLASRYGDCSCYFRHGNQQLCGDAEFRPPEDWCPEDEEDVTDTAAVYDLLTRLINEGHHVDIYDCWNGEEHFPIATLQVSLSQVPRNAFRFFQGYKFDLVK